MDIENPILDTFDINGISRRRGFQDVTHDSVRKIAISSFYFTTSYYDAANTKAYILFSNQLL